MAHKVPVAPPPISLKLRREALLLLDGQGAILETARELSALMRDAGIAGAVIGGVAVVLHGHVRTTRDIDVFIDGPAEPFAELLKAGFVHDPIRREFVRDGLPVHLVLLDQLGMSPGRRIEVDGVATVSLADLIAMKLRSGSSNLLRAQDLADVIGLIRRHQLIGEFATFLDYSVRSHFLGLTSAIAMEAHPDQALDMSMNTPEGRSLAPTFAG